MNDTKNYLIDTSVILDDPSILISIYQGGENRLYISDIILKELNGHKEDAISEKGFFAREFIRALETGLSSETEEDAKHDIELKDGDFLHKFNCVFESSPNDPIVIYAISREKYKNERDINDAKILNIAQDYNLDLLTNDISLKVIALSKKVHSESLKKDAVSKPENILFNHTIELEDANELSNTLEQIRNGKDYSQYMISMPDGTKKFYMPVGKNENEVKMDSSDFSEYRIAPHNLEQKFLLRMLSHPSVSIAIATGATGSGKTLMVLQEGLRRVADKNDPIEKIVYVRNTVTSNDKASELGFRKGDQNQKLNYFAAPLFGNINFILNNSISKKKMNLRDDYHENKGKDSNDKATETELFMKEYNIEVMDIAHMRGITLSNTYVIFDEAQNTSNATMQLCGTRAGKNTIFVILGDFRQVDHPYLSKNRNALVTMLQLAQKDNSIAALQLQKTIRSEVAAWFQDNL